MRESIPILGLIFIIVGALNAIANLILVAVALIMTVVMAVEGAQGHEGVVIELLESMDELGPLLITDCLIGFWCLLSAGFIVAGMQLRKFRGRTLAIVMCILGLVPCLASHPACTYVLVAAASIFGLVVLLNPDSARAFAETER